MKKRTKQVKKYTKQEITEMADRCFRRCWGCNRYEDCGGYGSGGDLLLSYSRSGCYEAHDLPWKSGHWCTYWGDKKHPDKEILMSLTWDNVYGTVVATKLVEPYELREKILNANPEIAALVKYCDNSNEEREQYFNKSENQAIIEFDKFNVYCETLRRYRFSRVDNRLLYPGANEWLRSMMVCYDKKTYKSLAQDVIGGDGIQISFACSPEKNYRIDPKIFTFDEQTKQVNAVFRNGSDEIMRCALPIGHLM